MNARTNLRISEVFADHPELATDRTRLRKVGWEDVGALFAYGSDPDVSRFVGWDTYRSIVDAESYVSTTLAKYDRRQLADWGIEHRRDNRFIGTVGFLWWETRDAAAEIGYVMAKPYWGQGLMTEIVREVMRFGWEVMGLNRIEAHTDVENFASQRVLEKCGMQYEGRLRKPLRSSDGFVDLLVYAALRQDRTSEIDSIDGGR